MRWLTEHFTVKARDQSCISTSTLTLFYFHSFHPNSCDVDNWPWDCCPRSVPDSNSTVTLLPLNVKILLEKGWYFSSFLFSSSSPVLTVRGAIPKTSAEWMSPFWRPYFQLDFLRWKWDSVYLWNTLLKAERPQVSKRISNGLSAVGTQHTLRGLLSL